MPAIVRITPRSADLGEGMIVRRALPTREQRMVGAWCFLDHAGPVAFGPGQGMHVGAHPHIGLQTFTWMIEGEVLHRDSLGNDLVIRPGQVNLMTAGHGIVHTEDSVADGQRLHLAQLWIALPPEAENCAPAFAHYPELPQWQEGGAQLTLLVGSHGGRTAPTQSYSPLFGLDLTCAAPTSLTLPLQPEFEYGLLPLTGELTINGEKFQADEFAYLGCGREQLSLQLGAGTQALLLGGEPFAEPVQMWWNFVASNKAAITEAQAQWESGDARFGTVGDGSARRLVAPPLPWSA